MQDSNRTASGTAQRKHAYALLIIDMISDYAFPGGNRLVGPAQRIGKRIAQLKTRAIRAGIPCIYVNDNAGHWNSDRVELVDRCLALNNEASRAVRLIEPRHEDYFVLKPRHSGFFASALHTLLTQLESRRLILTGLTTHQCVLFTATDAYMRDFELIIPRDCVASIAPSHTRQALSLFEISLRAETTPSARVRFSKVTGKRRSIPTS
jgi:nicotinamidase-related amidase